MPTLPTPSPLALWPTSERSRIRGVLTDIDDTLTTDGAITPDALDALQRLRTAGLPVLAITGRPAGWSEAFALAWPVDAIVAENGAVALWRGDDGLLCRDYLQDATTRTANFTRLQITAQRVLRELPQARLATDSPGRETDIAIDHSEFAHLNETEIAQVVALMRGDGLSATVSSIHINGWIGDHDKLAGARWIVRTRLGRDLDTELDRWVYVGDSTNDARMFGHFPHSVGVANVARFWAALSHHPRFVAQAERGAGFTEVADAVLSARSS
ncbi:MAG: HAD-IIB family hydrolase [Hydrogenophaga sp.]|jgi:HAD superfamily hydrolase (TIGR01484 family)|uniref:HAD-IIB family hydrolase n=1 Tax=Hydrogenophaga sp. TaxID=1904254 RepID=UPI0025C1ABCC|nr:HAD-IIB family hydrolase [Hydrogenophaga sp.]MDO9507487.1 HAD-IIB family hydrolase [Hydrogenophaga sp.]MDP2985543.1 HAD-IIB family hydrolase [Hydrogenophaga sp.]MDP3202575.1 HAD-IIB family hydrolase [Hydrogenophaga sp.]MDP3625259.1 HAD-IIB family hydrolase [Hydrogenophaga sp.]